MTTLAQAVKVIVQNSIDQDYLDECGTLAEVYQVEYGNYNGTNPKACMSYLQGLPSVCTIPFYNAEILELLAAQGISRKSEEAQGNLIDKYWQEAGYQFYMLVK
jgi:hypothetical protein